MIMMSAVGFSYFFGFTGYLYEYKEQTQCYHLPPADYNAKKGVSARTM